jgi:5'-nucleotidase
MKNPHRIKQLTLLFFIIFIFLSACSHTSEYFPKALTINIAHLNDTHSHLESDRDVEIIKFDGTDTKAFLGGFPRLKTVLDKMKNESDNFMLLHAGDAVQGTLYFTLFDGDADIEFLNILGIDAMTFGNHEFDKGPGLTEKLVDRIKFPITSANIDFTLIPSIAQKVHPFVIKNYNGEKVAIIGVTTENTPIVSNPGPNIKFNDVKINVANKIDELRSKGINKIVVISHIGYDEDIKLAQSVSGIDVIVGGHSHTLLGDKNSFHFFGLKPQGEYPTVIKNPDGKDVLIVQAWRWGGVIGLLKVEFDEAGDIKGYSGTPVLVMGPKFIRDKKEITTDSERYKRILQIINDSKIAGIFDEDVTAKKLLQPYKEQLDALMKSVIAQAKEDLIGGLNSGPGLLIADSMVWKTGVQIALINRGGVRRDIYAGQISVGTVMEVLPFNNTLFLLELQGSAIKTALEEGIDFQLSYNASNPLYPYVSGMKYSVNKLYPKGERISDIMVKNPEGNYEPINMQKTYKLVTNSYIASQGGDGYVSLRDYKGYKYDTGLIDYEVFIEYLKNFKTVFNPAEERIIVKTLMSETFLLIKPLHVQIYLKFKKAA